MRRDPVGGRWPRGQWRAVAVQPEARTETDGGAVSGRRRWSPGRKRGRKQHEGTARGSGDPSDGWNLVSPWAVTGTERHERAEAAARTQEREEGPGWYNVTDAQWRSGGGQCKRHHSGAWKAKVPLTRKQEARDKGRGGGEPVSTGKRRNKRNPTQKLV